MATWIAKISAGACLAALLFVASCSEDVYVGDQSVNEPPTIRLTCGPLEGLMTSYRIHFYWMGNDPDGRVDHYEYVIVTGDPLGFSAADTTGADAWTATILTDMEYEVSAEEYDTTVTISQKTYARYHQMHTFFIRSVDDRGACSEPAYRSFNAFTLAPQITITEPEPSSSGSTQFLTPVTRFRWEGKDPIDSPQNYQPVDSVRFMHTNYYLRLLEDMNERPEIFERRWSPWFSYTAPGDSGTSTVLGDDEVLEFSKTYIFAVQAKDEAGAISSIFDERTNVRRFMIKKPTGPLVTVMEPYLGISKYIGTLSAVTAYYTPAGFAVNFSWAGDASGYGAFVSTYRYGWDIIDLADPSQWEVDPNPSSRSAPPRSFLSGVHSLFVEAVDNVGIVTLAKIEISVVPLLMDRDLLWVDDYLSSNDFVQTNYAIPTENEHDAFWIDVCSIARGFDPDIDVYDTSENNFQTPELRKMWRYKSIIWTYGTARWDFNSWVQTVNFTPEDEDLSGFESRYTYNVMMFYTKLGGHLWTCGRSDKFGGMAGCNPLRKAKLGPYEDLMTINLVWPLYLQCEAIRGPGGCSDTTAVNAMPYKDYCIRVLDKVYGVLRSDGTVPARDINRDAMTHAYRDSKDPFTLDNPDLPPELHLWETVTAPGMFFDPMVRGMHYVEIYDPSYWMKSQGLRSQSCFHPMYRMKSRNTNSVLDNTVVAIWGTAHADVNAGAPGTVAAPSVHFGFPLWYFDRDEVHQLATAIFTEWGLPLNGDPSARQ